MPSNTAIAKVEKIDPDALPPPEVLQAVFLNADISQLSPRLRIEHYLRVCQTLGLNPYTKPLDYLKLDGRWVLYVRKDGADQLRRRYRISLGKPRVEIIDDLYCVNIEARTPGGRTDADVGVVDLSGLKGVARANGIMKAHTKAKRRATLSICGLGMLDESEIDTMDDANPLDFDPETGEFINEPPPPDLDAEPTSAKPVKPARKITAKQRTRLFTLATKRKWKEPALRAMLAEKFQIESTKEISETIYDAIIAAIELGPPVAKPKTVTPPKAEEIFDKPLFSKREREPGEEG